MHRVTDAFGPIPYSQIGANGEIATPYDSQEVTYNTFFDELNAAIATLNENSNEQLVPTADYIYKGDVKKWIRFANSLKLRLAIRIAYANPVYFINITGKCCFCSSNSNRRVILL